MKPKPYNQEQLYTESPSSMNSGNPEPKDPNPFVTLNPNCPHPRTLQSILLSRSPLQTASLVEKSKRQTTEEIPKPQVENPGPQTLHPKPQTHNPKALNLQSPKPS